MPAEGTVAGFEVTYSTKLAGERFAFRVPSLDGRWGDYRLDSVRWDPEPRPPATEAPASIYHGFLMQSETEVRGYFSQRVSESTLRGWFASFAANVTCAPPDTVARWEDAFLASRELGGPSYQPFGAHSAVPIRGSEPQLFKATIDSPSCLPQLFDRLGGLAAASDSSAEQSAKTLGARILGWGEWSFTFTIGNKLARETGPEPVELRVGADDRAWLFVTAGPSTVCSDQALRDKARESLTRLGLGTPSFDGAQLEIPRSCGAGAGARRPSPTPERRHNPSLAVQPRPHVEACPAAAPRREPSWMIDVRPNQLASLLVTDGPSVYPGLSQYEARTGKPGWRIEVPPEDSFTPSRLIAHPGTRLLVSAGSSGIRAFDLSSGAPMWRSPALSLPVGWVGPFGSLALSPDGQRIAAVNDKSLAVLDARTGGERWSMPWQIHAGPVAFAPDGQRVYAVQQAHSDPSFSVLAADATSGAQIWKLSGSLPSEAVLRANTIRTSSNGRLILVSGSSWLENAHPLVLMAIDASAGAPSWTKLDQARSADEDIVLRVDEARGMVRVFGTGPGDLSTPHDVFESDYALKSGEARGSWSHPVPDYVEFAVSPDGRRVYAATQDRVWDHETGQQTRSEFFVIALDAEAGTVAWCATRALLGTSRLRPTLAVAPDGRTLFVVSQGTRSEPGNPFSVDVSQLTAYEH